ncbi:MAG: thiamine diphosphokinase [Arcanobacterium sp.]|nr:thiamine diphosphokinase [Arcanobacterium sp.]
MGSHTSSCLVVTARVDGRDRIREQIAQQQWDFVLCADGGQLVADELGLTPDAYIGDYDSSPRPQGRYYYLSAASAVLSLDAPEREQLVRDGRQPQDDAPKHEKSPAVFVLPAEKAMTDSEAAVDVAVQLGFSDIALLGGLGGRFDHTLGNLAILAKYVDSPVNVRIFDGFNSVEMVGVGTYTVMQRGFRYFGVLPYGGSAVGVTMRGVKYEVADFDFSDSSTRGVSNEIVGELATLSVRAGRLLLVCSRDE